MGAALAAGDVVMAKTYGCTTVEEKFSEEKFRKIIPKSCLFIKISLKKQFFFYRNSKNNLVLGMLEWPSLAPWHVSADVVLHRLGCGLVDGRRGGSNHSSDFDSFENNKHLLVPH